MRIPILKSITWARAWRITSRRAARAETSSARLPCGDWGSASSCCTMAVLRTWSLRSTLTRVMAAKPMPSRGISTTSQPRSSSKYWISCARCDLFMAESWRNPKGVSPALSQLANIQCNFCWDHGAKMAQDSKDKYALSTVLFFDDSLLANVALGDGPSGPTAEVAQKWGRLFQQRAAREQGADWSHPGEGRLVERK